MSALCKCGTLRDKQIAGPYSSFPDRAYYKCQGCGVFDWADQTPRKIFSSLVGPICKCGKVTVQRTVKKETSPNKGKKFWSCAEWPGGCGFFEFCENKDSEASPRTLNSSLDRKRKPTPGFASYLSDWKRSQIMEKLLEVEPQKLKVDTEGRYDKLQVVGTWKIGNPARMEKYEAAKRRIKSSSPKVSSYNFSAPLEDTMNELGNYLLDKEAGEVFLLHGTNPENLYGILFEGLDPEVASNGNFGRGVYFAENAVKTNQYTSADERWQREGPLGDLHEKIYKGQKHPGNVRYVLVCRVLL